MLQILILVLLEQPKTTQTLYCRPVHISLLIPQNTGKSQSTYSIVVFPEEHPGRRGKMLQILIAVLLYQPETTQTLHCRPVHISLLIPQNTGKSQASYNIVVFPGEHPVRGGKMLQILIPEHLEQPGRTQILYCRPVHISLLIPQNTGKSQSTYSIIVFRGQHPEKMKKCCRY